MQKLILKKGRMNMGDLRKGIMNFKGGMKSGKSERRKEGRRFQMARAANVNK